MGRSASPGGVRCPGESWELRGGGLPQVYNVYSIIINSYEIMIIMYQYDPLSAPKGLFLQLVDWLKVHGFMMSLCEYFQYFSCGPRFSRQKKCVGALEMLSYEGFSCNRGTRKSALYIGIFHHKPSIHPSCCFRHPCHRKRLSCSVLTDCRWLNRSGSPDWRHFRKCRRWMAMGEFS